MRFPNLIWAVAQHGPQYRFAAALGESESWLSRRLSGRVPLSLDDRQTIANALGYPAEWLFQEPQPPARMNGQSLMDVSS
jgi:transcriptional regulator with XRE-family HTH domain